MASKAPKLAEIVAKINLHLKRFESDPRDEANKYLAWLDAGNQGKHWKALRSEVTP